MAVPIPESHMRLLTEPIIAHLATVMPDGRHKSTPCGAITTVRMFRAATRSTCKRLGLYSTPGAMSAPRRRERV